jgi:WD40 repeat protein
VNLLRVLRGDLRGLDLSGLTIRQAFLQDIEAHDTSLAGARLDDAVLAEAFNYPASVALNDDGTLLAAGTSTGEVCLWRVADRTLIAILQGHTGLVTSLALRADAGLLASGSVDGTVRLWEVGSARRRLVRRAQW